MKQQYLKFLILFCIFTAGVYTDLATKQLATENLSGSQTITIIEGILEFTYTENSGMIFGLLNDTSSPFKHYGLTILTIISIFLVIFIVWRLRDKPFLYHLPFFLILTGAIANLIDRLNNGRVVDFIHLHYKSYLDWPFLFNCADAFITIGEIILLVLILFKGRELESAVFKKRMS